MKKRNNLALVLMIIIIVLLNADQNNINGMLGPIKKEFNINDGDIGFIGGLFTIVGAVISLIWGYLSDKGNRKKLFAYSVLIGQIPCLLTAFVTDYSQFFILRILTGIGVGASFPTTFSMIGDMYDEEHRPTVVTWVTTAMGIGIILGAALSGYLGPIYGWRSSFILIAVTNLIALILFYILVPEPKRGATEESIKDLVELGYHYPKTIKLSDYISLFKIKTNLYLFIQGILGTIPWGAFLQFLVEFLQNRGLSTGDATTVFEIFAVGNVPGTIIGGIIGLRLLKKKAAWLPRFCAITTAVGAVTSIALFTLIPVSNFWVTSVMGFIASFLVSLTGPNVRTMLLDTNVPENRGAIFSIFNLTDSVGTGIGKFIAGKLSVGFGLSLAMNASALVWFPCAIFLWICSFIFAKDIQRLHQKITMVAQEMKQKYYAEA
jgi:predicted MFS family arabinose efflux permease